VARKRMTRKELVQKDEITSTLEHTTEFVVEQRKPILVVVSIVVALVIVLVGFNVYSANRRAASQSALSEVIDIFTDIDGYDSEEERFEAALSEAQTVQANYSNLAAGQIAEYYVALSNQGLGNTTEAVRILQALVENGDDTINQVARFALAESYRTHGELETAITVYQELEDSGGYSRVAVLYELGRLHEEISKPDEARSYYQKIVGEHPDSGFRADADRALKRLGVDDEAPDEAES
jgi:tetratricopeptide (TPR) repeat protein